MGLVNGGATLLQINPGSLNFGNVAQGQSVQLTMYLQNASANNTINLFGVSADNSKFTFGSLPTQLRPHSTNSFFVTYTAGTIGTDTGTATISSDADNDPVQFSLTGTSIAAGTPAISVNPSSFIFPSTKANTVSAVQNFVVTNTGTLNCTVQIPVVASPFAGSGLPGGPTVLTPGQTLTFGVTFNPTGGGYIVNASGITITSDATGSPMLIDLEGLGVTITPAYIVVGGTENGFVAFDEVMKQFQATNFTCEDPASATRLINPAGPGMEARLMRCELQFEDKGAATVVVTASVKRYNSSNQTATVQPSVRQIVNVGTAAADGTIFSTLADLGIAGEFITLTFVPTGPFWMTAYIPRFTEGNEVSKT